MSTSKYMIKYEQAGQFRKFLEGRGIECRDGKGDWQLFQVKVPGIIGWKSFCHNANKVVSGPSELDAHAVVFNAPVVDSPKVSMDVVEVGGLIKYDSDLLDDFAIAALPSIIEYRIRDRKQGEANMGPDIARLAYKQAMYMMAERAKHQTK